MREPMSVRASTPNTPTSSSQENWALNFLIVANKYLFWQPTNAPNKDFD